MAHECICAQPIRIDKPILYLSFPFASYEDWTLGLPKPIYLLLQNPCQMSCHHKY